jgi:hypothetical protein
VVAPPQVANTFSDTLAPVLVATTDSAAAPVDPAGPSPARTVASTGAAPQARVVEARENGTATAQLAVAALTADYDREVARLRRLIEERRNQLDPVTVAIIEKNLQVIDVAIAECQRAVARDPSSRFLIESLNQSLQSKVELMRTAALLPART